MAQTTAPSVFSTHDPAHPDSENTNHTTSTGEKPTTAVEAILDPEFLPTLDAAPPVQKAKSHLLLLTLLLGALVGAYMYGFELFQVNTAAPPQVLAAYLGGALALGWVVLWASGAHYIDWWALVVGYWWLSLPAGAAAGLLLVMAQEKQSGIKEVD